MRCVLLVASAAIVAIALLPRAANAEQALCPINLESVVDIGQAASGKFESYQVAVTGAAGKVSSIDFSLRTSDPTNAAQTSWHDISLAQEPRVQVKWKLPRSLGTFDRLYADVTAAAIVQVVRSAGSQSTVCEPVWQPVTDVQSDFGLYFTQVDSVNDSVHPLSAAVQSFPHHVYSGARTLNYVDRGYPRAQMLAGIEGTSIVDVRFDATGIPKTYSILSSSQDDALDADAISNARMTGFAPPMRDGKPDPDGWIELNYSYPPDSAPSAPTDSCPAQVSYAFLSNIGQPANPDWYRIVATTVKKGITSLVVGLQDSTGTISTVSWNSKFIPPPGGLGPYLEARGELARTSAPLLKVWVDNVAFADGHQVPCKKYYAVVEQPGLLGRLYQAGSAAPDTTSIFTVDPASFVRVAHPIYPSFEIGARVTGRVFVSTVIDPKGVPISAFVVGSSGNENLDKSGVDAAMASTYSASALGSTNRVVWTSYGFLDEPGDAFFRNHI
jgi:TonB family protein